MLARGMAQVEQAVYDKAYKSIWVGPHRVMSAPCEDNVMPCIPFWGYREDLTAVPYGLIRSMISPQDEVNARRQKMMWLLHSKRLIADSDAFDLRLNSIDDVMERLASPNATILLNPNRTNKSGAVAVESDAGLAAQQFEILLESKRAVQEVVGVFNAMLGDNKGGATSGIAINSLVEQGMTALAEINDNYRYARGLVGERLLTLVRADMVGRRVTVNVDENGKKKKVKANKGRVIGIKCKATVYKNRFSKPNESIEVQLVYPNGLSAYSGLFDFLLNDKKITKVVGGKAGNYKLTVPVEGVDVFTKKTFLQYADTIMHALNGTLAVEAPTVNVVPAEYEEEVA